MTKAARASAVGAGLVLWVALAGSARADIAVLGNGQTMKIKSFRVDGEVVWLTLQTGGEMGLPLQDIRGLVPDRKSVV